MTGAGLLGLGLGALLRSTPAAISSLFGLMFLLSGVAALLLPDSWGDVVEFLPTNAANSFTAVSAESGSLAPAAGLAVFAAYLLAILVAAAWRLKRSDA